jgi:hypothetical protein
MLPDKERRKKKHTYIHVLMLPDNLSPATFSHPHPLSLLYKLNWWRGPSTGPTHCQVHKFKSLLVTFFVVQFSTFERFFLTFCHTVHRCMCSTSICYNQGQCLLCMCVQFHNSSLHRFVSSVNLQNLQKIKGVPWLFFSSLTFTVLAGWKCIQSTKFLPTIQLFSLIFAWNSRNASSSLIHIAWTLNG